MIMPREICPNNRNALAYPDSARGDSLAIGKSGRKGSNSGLNSKQIHHVLTAMVGIADEALAHGVNNKIKGFQG